MCSRTLSNVALMACPAMSCYTTAQEVYDLRTSSFHPPCIPPAPPPADGPNYTLACRRRTAHELQHITFDNPGACVAAAERYRLGGRNRGDSRWTGDGGGRRAD